MKIAACCITWQEPLVGRIIECFNRQTHEDRELVVLDDAGWYPENPKGDRWRVISFDRRFSSIGSKRNAAAALASINCDAFAVCDADDVYLPHWLASIDHALKTGEWCRPTQILEWTSGGNWNRCLSWKGDAKAIAYHGSWAYRRDAFERVNGYPVSGEEDWPMSHKLQIEFGDSSDTICDRFPDPYYAYCRNEHQLSKVISRQRNIENCHSSAYIEKVNLPRKRVSLNIGFDIDYGKIYMPNEVCCRPW